MVKQFVIFGKFYFEIKIELDEQIEKSYYV